MRAYDTGDRTGAPDSWCNEGNPFGDGVGGNGDGDGEGHGDFRADVGPEGDGGIDLEKP